MFCSEAKAEQQNGRLADPKRNLRKSGRRTWTVEECRLLWWIPNKAFKRGNSARSRCGDYVHQLQSNEANYIHLEAIRLKSSCIPPVNTVPQGGHIECSCCPFTFTAFTCPFTTGVVGAPQMTSQPLSSIFLCFSLPSGTWRTPGLSIP